MAKREFFDKPYDEGTLTKLGILEQYAREWLPVFLASQERPVRTIHLFDFFAGPGTDSKGVLGSPLRLLRQISSAQPKRTGDVKLHAHFFDDSSDHVQELRTNIARRPELEPDVIVEVEHLDFRASLERSAGILEDRSAAKLVFIDQFGVDMVDEQTFVRLSGFPKCDVLFFVASNTLHRFRDHPAIKQKIARPSDSHQVHLAVLDYYRRLIPPGRQFYLAPFSIRKGANIYGLIFGSSHMLGLDKFLTVAWKNDSMNGEANFDVHRDNLIPGQARLDLPEFRMSKAKAFEADLEVRLRSGALADEVAIMHVCFEHGMLRQHAQPVLRKLKREGVLELDFRVPDIRRLKSPRPVRVKS